MQPILYACCFAYQPSPAAFLKSCGQHDILRISGSDSKLEKEHWHRFVIADTLDKKMAIAKPNTDTAGDDAKASALEPPLIVAFRGTHEMSKWFANLSVFGADSFSGKLNAQFLEKAESMPTSFFVEQVRFDALVLHDCCADFFLSTPPYRNRPLCRRGRCCAVYTEASACAKANCGRPRGSREVRCCIVVV